MDKWSEFFSVIAFVFFVFVFWRIQRRMNAMPRNSDEQLRHIITLGKEKLLIGPAVRELHKRGIDVRFAIPRLCELMASDNMALRAPAHSAMAEAFPSLLEGIDYRPVRNPSAETKAYLAALGEADDRA